MKNVLWRLLSLILIFKLYSINITYCLGPISLYAFAETIFVRDNFRQRHHQHLRKEFEPQCGHVTSECNLILVVFLLQELNGPKNGQEAKNPILVKLSEPFTARYVRFIPTSAPVLKVMRAELYGCMAEPLPPFGGMRTFAPLISTYKLSAHLPLP